MAHPRAVVVLTLLALVPALACDGGDDGDTGATTAAGTGATTTAATDGGPPATEGDPTTTGADGGDTTGTAGPPLENACESVGDCRLVNDCCTCEAIHRDAEAPACAVDCERPLCDVYGVGELLCSHTCRILLVECDPAMITCDDAPPTCDAGLQPSLQERCWSGRCVPSELCRPY